MHAIEDGLAQRRDDVLRKLVRIAVERAVLVGAVGVIHGLEQLDVEAVDGATIQSHDAFDLLSVDEILQLPLSCFVHRPTPARLWYGSLLPGRSLLPIYCNGATGMSTPLTEHSVRQVAYFVPDVVAAARRHASLFGSGPYYVAEHIPLTLCEHRGRPAELDHTSAYGQWGEVMIEFVQQNNPGPSVFRDLYADGQQGFHHVALIVDGLKVTMRKLNDGGYETALYAEVARRGRIRDDRRVARLRPFRRAV